MSGRSTGLAFGPRPRALVINFRTTFAVVLPVYNLTAVIGTVLSGLSSETWSRIDRMIVLDNASTDGTADSVQTFIDSNPSIGHRIDLVPLTTDQPYADALAYFLAKRKHLG